MIDEVEQITEPAAGIPGRPQVQLGLHPPYPCLSPGRGKPRPASIHQRLRPLQHLACVNPLDPFAMQTAFPPSDYYGSSAPPRRHRQATRRPAAAGPGWPGRRREPRGGSHVHHQPIVGRGAQLYPCGIATVTPQAFTVASPASDLKTAREFPARHERRVRAAIQPISAGFELAGDLRGVTALVPLVHLPVLLAGPAPSGSTSTSRRCRGCLPPSPAFPGSGCPQLHYAAATAQRQSPSTSARLDGASWRSRSPSQCPACERSSGWNGRWPIVSMGCSNRGRGRAAC